MAIKMETVWSLPTLEANLPAIKAKAQEMIDQQIYIPPDIPELTTFDQATNQVTAVRFWSDEAAANAWVDFVQPLGPVSVTLTPVTIPPAA